MKVKSILAIFMAVVVLVMATWGFTRGFKAFLRDTPERQENAEHGVSQEDG